MKLIIVSGPPCSGKTTFIKNNYDKFNIISSDKEIYLIKQKSKNLNHVELNKLGLEEIYKKIENNIKKNIDTVFDGTNLTPEKRQIILDICKNIKGENQISIEGVNIITPFNTIYNNWIKRGKDIKIESVFFLYSIYQKIEKSEGFNSVKNIEFKTNIKCDYLKKFLETGKINKSKLLEENKDIKFLNNFWKKSGKDYLKEYNSKIDYLEDLKLEDKLALLHSDIKYFYQDFIVNVEMIYNVDYETFINLFTNNIINYKVKILGLNKEKTSKSLIKLIDIF